MSASELTRKECSVIAKKLRAYARFLDAPDWMQEALPPENPHEWAFGLARSQNQITCDLEEIVDEAIEVGE